MRTWLHPTAVQLQRGYHQKEDYEILKRKLKQRTQIEGFTSAERLHATVLIQGVPLGSESQIWRTVVRLLYDAPLGMADARSVTFHVVGHGRPLIGLVADSSPLDRLAMLQQFTDCGVVPEPSGQS